MQIQIHNNALSKKGHYSTISSALKEELAQICKEMKGIETVHLKMIKILPKTVIQQEKFEIKITGIPNQYGVFNITTPRYKGVPSVLCSITGIDYDEFKKHFEKYVETQKKAKFEPKPVSEIATLVAPVAVVAPAPIDFLPVEKEPLKLSEMMDQRLCFYMDLLKIRVGTAPTSDVRLADVRNIIIDLGVLAKGNDKTFYIKSFPNVMRNWLYAPIAHKVDMKIGEIHARGENQEPGYSINWPTIELAISSHGKKMPIMKWKNPKSRKVRKTGTVPAVLHQVTTLAPSSPMSNLVDLMVQLEDLAARAAAYEKGGVACRLLDDIRTANTELEQASSELQKAKEKVANLEAKLTGFKTRHSAMPHPLSADEQSILEKFQKMTAPRLAAGYILMTTDCNDQWSSQRVELL